MLSVSKHNLLEMWELGQQLSQPSLAAMLLRLTRPEWSEDKILDMPIGERDCALMTVYAENFSRRLTLLEACPNCAEMMEFELTIAELLTQKPNTYPITIELPASDAIARKCPTLRLPTSRDLLSALSEGSAGKTLLERCIPSHASDMSIDDRERDQLEKKLKDADPMAHIKIALTCHKCEHRTESLFDIVAILWKTWSEKAQILLNEVCVLAAHFGWSEQSIFNMSDFRRQYYLSRLAQ